MSEDKLLKDLKSDFSKLNEGNKQYLLAISQALLFAQNTMQSAKNN
ncbi:hypothetical protein B0H39_005988 [Clostridium beijerinckii]|nr:hypothetical protein [Clostridium beijerinckii]NOW87957.1 hypothetical protein [Clostridium beijerinckii]